MNFITPLTAVLSHTVFPIIAAIVAGFISVLLKKLSTRYHLGNLAGLNQLIVSVAENAIGLAEEKALAALKNNGSKVTSNGKLDIAVAHVLNTIPAISRSTAENYIHAILAKTSDVGATNSTILRVSK